MSRAVSLEATCVFVKSSRRMGESRFVLQKAGHELYLVRGTNFMKVSWRLSRQGTKSLLFSFSKKLFKRKDLGTISPHMFATKRNAPLALVLVLLCAAAESVAQQNHWIGSWATSQQLAEPKNSLSADDLNDVTLRQIVHLSIGGSELRVHLSNRFGTAPLHFTGVHIAKAVSAASDKIVAGTDKALTFSGKPDITIPAGADYI